MVATVNSFVPADYTVWAIAGAVFITGALDFLMSLGNGSSPSSSPPPSSPPSTRDPRRRMPRTLMYLAVAFWGASLILPLNVIWGPSSVVAGTNVTSFTSQGWMCRIFITLCLGVCAPLAGILGAVILYSVVVDTDMDMTAVGKLDKLSSMVLDHPVALALLVALPFGAAQSVIAWISLTLTYDDQPIEETPTALISTWLAPFAAGNAIQCDSASVDGEYPCTACVFPAASVLVHGTWTVLAGLVVLYAALRLRRGPKRTMWLAGTLVVSGVSGLVCMGVGLYYHDPFTWANQGLWLGYVATVLASAGASGYLF